MLKPSDLLKELDSTGDMAPIKRYLVPATIIEEPYPPNLEFRSSPSFTKTANNVTNRPSTYVCEDHSDDDGMPRAGSKEFSILLPKIPDIEVGRSDKNVWNLAVTAVREKRDKFDNFHSTLIVVGPHAMGKSSMIQQFLGSKEQLRPTNGIDFSVGKSGNTLCHIYEVGGAITEHVDLMELPITYCQYPDSLTLILVLDLTKPAFIWDTVQLVLEHGRKAFKNTLEELRADLNEVPLELYDNAMKDLQPSGVSMEANVAEADVPFPLTVGIIGAKYDEFQNFPLEVKEKICKNVRLIALKLGASICFYSNKDPKMQVRIKELFSYYAFKLPFPCGCSADSERPILIPERSDTLRYITSNTESTIDTYTWANMREVYQREMGIKYNVPKPTCDPGKDPRYADSYFDKRRDLAMKEIKDTTAARRARDVVSDENFFVDTEGHSESTTELTALFQNQSLNDCTFASDDDVDD